MDDYEKIKATKKIIIKKVIIKLAISLFLVGLTSWWSIPYAEVTRGYFAIGGEYCLIMMMGVLPWLF